MYRAIVALALCFTVAACGAGPTPNNGGVGYRDRTVITLDEIAAAQMTNRTAYDLISKLRPEFFRSRGQTSPGSAGPATAIVYVDAMRFGDLASLRGLNSSNISLVQYVSASDATTRFGTGHGGGAILITTR